MTSKFKTAAITAAFALVGAVGMAALPQAALAQPLTVQGEAAMHPRMVHAIHAMEAALAELQAAPDDFGGYKAQAIQQTRAAIHSLRHALFYRMNMDDAAIDAARF